MVTQVDNQPLVDGHPVPYDYSEHKTVFDNLFQKARANWDKISQGMHFVRLNLNLMHSLDYLDKDLAKDLIAKLKLPVFSSLGGAFERVKENFSQLRSDATAEDSENAKISALGTFMGASEILGNVETFMEGTQEIFDTALPEVLQTCSLALGNIAFLGTLFLHIRKVRDAKHLLIEDKDLFEMVKKGGTTAESAMRFFIHKHLGLTQKELDLLLEEGDREKITLIQELQKKFTFDEDILSIVEDEVSRYFQGTYTDPLSKRYLQIKNGRIAHYMAQSNPMTKELDTSIEKLCNIDREINSRIPMKIAHLLTQKEKAFIRKTNKKTFVTLKKVELILKNNGNLQPSDIPNCEKLEKAMPLIMENIELISKKNIYTRIAKIALGLITLTALVFLTFQIWIPVAYALLILVSVARFVIFLKTKSYERKHLHNVTI
ncbi:MAG: hypothetical protein COT84_06015 [Chlamydiae bacterium CG10_big_fil_rev_8_21_14_0_10_35_9]|nr:MAG: hypothetical protein COT84_06015 [Chlamydiae bacterium CG10_big_fil_rev_8_21_14_0_10_35_9]